MNATAAERPRSRAGALWLPLLAAAAMLAATGFGWRAADRRERSRIQTLVAAQAATSAAHLAGRLDALGDGLDRGAQRWLGLPGLNLTMARVESAILLRDPRVHAVIWLHPDLRFRWAFDAAGQVAADDLARWSEQTRSAWASGDRRVLRLGPVLDGPSGAAMIGGRVPVLVAGGLDGVMLCLYEASVALREASEGLSGAFSLRVLAPDDSLLLELDGVSGVAEWSRSHDLEHDAIRARVEVSPTLPTLADLSSGLPRTVAIAGMGFALLLGLAVRVGQVEGARARAAAENAQLHAEIVARRRAEAELARRALELQRSNEDLGRFAHVVSHDLRAPLGSIDMNLQLLDESPEESERRVRKARAGVARMLTMIDGLLDYARTGGADDPEPVDTRMAAAEAVSNLDARVRAQGATVQVDELPTVLGQRDQLVRLFQNLIGNALQHGGGDGAPRVEVRCEAQGPHWLFRVQDDGPGISVARAERIFSLFAAEGDAAGSGVGLAICRRIVEGAGGRIWVQSEPDSGACFVFTWPRSSPAARQDSEP